MEDFYIFFLGGVGGCFLVPLLQFDLKERDGVCYSDIFRDASMHYVRRSQVPNPTNTSLQGVSLSFLLLLLGSVFFLADKCGRNVCFIIFLGWPLSGFPCAHLQLWPYHPDGKPITPPDFDVDPGRRAGATTILP